MDELLVATPEAGVTCMRLHRPEARNALNLALRAALEDALLEAADDPDVGAVVLTGDDRAFAAGADIKEMAGVGPVEIRSRGIERFWESVSGFPKPLLAAVNGYAFGAGCELALACDIVIAGEGASFALPEVRLGIMPGGGGTQRLARAVGRPRAMRYLLTGDRIPAPEALEMGLVSEVVEDAQVLPHAVALAARIATLAPLSLARIKQVVDAGMDAPLASALRLERESFYFLTATRDKEEGVAAFIEKRKPVFEGR